MVEGRRFFDAAAVVRWLAITAFQQNGTPNDPASKWAGPFGARD